jgi:hypothetical protein
VTKEVGGQLSPMGRGGPSQKTNGPTQPLWLKWAQQCISLLTAGSFIANQTRRGDAAATEQPLSLRTTLPLD